MNLSIQQLGQAHADTTSRSRCVKSEFDNVINNKIAFLHLRWLVCTAVNARLKRIAVAALVVCVATACAPSDDPEGFCRRFSYLDEAFKGSEYGFAPATLRLAVNKDFLGDPGRPLSDFLDTLERILYEMDFEGRVDFLGSDRSVLEEFQEKWSEVYVYCEDTFSE